MSTFDEKENEILPSLDVGKRKRSSILKSVGNAVLPINKKKKLSFSTIQYQEVFADGTSRIFYQSINDISASESVVEPSKIFPNDDMDEESSGDDLLNKTKYFSNDDLSLDSQSDSIPKIVVNSQPSQPSQPQSELMSMTLIDPVPDPKEYGNESIVSVSQSESTHKEVTEEITNEVEQPSLDISSAKLSHHPSSSTFVETSHAISESETQQSIQIPNLTHLVAAGDDALESISTQNSSSHVPKRLSSSNNIEKSFALSKNDTFSTSEISHHPSSSTFAEKSHAISESETQPGIQVPDLTHLVAAGEDDVLESTSTQNFSRSICDNPNSTPQAENADKKGPESREVTMVVDNKSVAPDQADSIVSMTDSLKESSDSTIATEADQASLDITNIELSVCTSCSFVEASPSAPESDAQQQGIQIPDLTHFVAAGGDDTLESISTQSSSSHVSKRLSSSNLNEKSFALSENDTFSTPEISLRRSSSSFVETSHAIPESDTQQQGIQVPDLTHCVAAGEDDTQESISTQNFSRSICDDSNSQPQAEKADEKWPEFGEVTMVVDNKSVAPDQADSIVSMTGSESTLKEPSDNTIATEADQASLNITNIELSVCASCSFVEASPSAPESDTQQQGIQIPDLTHFVAAGGDDTLESISTQNSSSHLTKRLSSSNLIEKSFAFSENDTFSTPDHSLYTAVSSTPRVEDAPKNWPDFGEVTVMVDNNKTVTPDQDDSMISTAQSESRLEEESHESHTIEADQPSLKASSTEFSHHQSSPSLIETSQAVPELEEQLGVELPDLTHLVATSEDGTQSSLKTQCPSTHVSEKISSSEVENSFAISEHVTLPAPDRTSGADLINSTARTENIDKNWPEFGEVTAMVDNKSVEPNETDPLDLTTKSEVPDHCMTIGRDCTRASIGTQCPSTHNSERISSGNAVENSFVISEHQTLSAPDGSMCADTSSPPQTENVDKNWPEFGEVTAVVDNKSIVPYKSDSIVSMAESESTLKESISIANATDNCEMDHQHPVEKSSNEDSSRHSPEISLHRSSSPFVEISHAIPECEMLPSHRILDLSRFAPNGRDETLFPSHNTLPFNYFSQTGPGSIKPSVVSHYFGQAVSVYIQYLRISATRDKILQFSWVLGFKNGATFVATSDSGDEVVVEPENRKMLIIIEKLINTELSKVEKSLDSIVSHRELFQEVEKIFDRIANLATELVDLWKRCDGKLLSKSENSFGCGFYIEGLKERVVLVIDLDLQNYPNQKVSVRLRLPETDRLFYTTIKQEILDSCRAVNPAVNKLNYLRRVVKSAEDFISDYKKQGEVRIRCACSHSANLCAIISTPRPEVDRATLVERVANVLTSSWDDVPLYKSNPNFRRKIRKSLRRNVKKHWEKIQLKYS